VLPLVHPRYLIAEPILTMNIAAIAVQSGVLQVARERRSPTDVLFIAEVRGGRDAIVASECLTWSALA
jgi:hypothetical protein